MNFIIYEDEKKYISNYKKAIFNIMSEFNIDYNSYIYNKWNDNILNEISNITGNKIFILDVEVSGKNGIDFARTIRNNGDWVSPIIVVTGHEEFRTVGYTSRILMLDFIVKNNDMLTNLIDALKFALSMSDTRKYLSITSKNEIFKVLYDDILYIEKNLNDNSSIVVTKNNFYTTRKSIVVFENELDNDVFYKCHRSCIVNINNITKVDFDSNKIYFNSICIDLLSRSHKKGLKEKMASRL